MRPHAHTQELCCFLGLTVRAHVRASTCKRVTCPATNIHILEAIERPRRPGAQLLFGHHRLVHLRPLRHVPGTPRESLRVAEDGTTPEGERSRGHQRRQDDQMASNLTSGKKHGSRPEPLTKSFSHVFPPPGGKRGVSTLIDIEIRGD